MFAVDDLTAAASGVDDLQRYAWGVILAVAIVALMLAALIIVKGGRRGS